MAKLVDRSQVLVTPGLIESSAFSCCTQNGTLAGRTSLCETAGNENVPISLSSCPVDISSSSSQSSP